MVKMSYIKSNQMIYAYFFNNKEYLAFDCHSEPKKLLNDEIPQRAEFNNFIDTIIAGKFIKKLVDHCEYKKFTYRRLGVYY